MNRLFLLASCALVACSLDVPGTGPALTDDDYDPIHVGDPIDLTPGSSQVGSAPTIGGSSSAVTPGAVAQVAADGGIIAVDASTTTTSTTTTTTTTAGPGSSAGPSSDPGKPADPADSSAFTLTSSAFDDGARLPSAFTCKGADHSPPLTWLNPPANTKSFALVLTSKSAAKPNASAAVEWVVWQIPAARTGLPQGVAAGSQPSNVPSARQDAANEDSSGAGGFTGAGGLTGYGGTVGLGVGVGGGGVGVGASFGGSWGGAIAGVSPAVPVTSGAPFYPTDTGTEPRYHGPCGASAATYEFTLFALDASATSQWGSFVSIETVTQWIKTRSNVLAQASLSATSP